MSLGDTRLRPWSDGDSVAELTTLLHRAYAPLGAAGMNFTGVDQTEAQTRERIDGGHCWVVERDGRLIGTVTVNGMFDPNRQAWARATPWFYRADVAHLHQYAVDPGEQGQGLGGLLLAGAEAWARDQGCSALALDTAEPAQALRERYRRAGFAEVDLVQWQGKRYRSVVMLKPLAEPAPTTGDAQHHAASVRTLWAHFQARDWAAARALFADHARLLWPASGEQFGDADTIVRLQRLYPEGWSLHQHEVTPLADGRVHSWVQVDQAGQRFHAHTLWRFDGDGRVCEAVETWATAEAPPAWRSADTLGPAYRRDDPRA